MIFPQSLEGGDAGGRTILATLSHYLPGYKSGGPQKSVVNLVDRLGAEFNFKIVTSDRDLGDSQPYRDILADSWMRSAGCEVMYVSEGSRGFSKIATLISSVPHDVLYLNSFFSPTWTIKPLLARYFGLIPKKPTIVAPRGEFSAGALRIKGLKKRAYVALGMASGLFSNLIWHASTDMESQDIRRILGDRAKVIRMASDLPGLLVSDGVIDQPRKTGEPLRLIFLARISPMKNLDYALRVLSQVRTPVIFSIYGPPEDLGYHEECQRLASRLPDHVQVRWEGPVEPSQVPKVMAAHDLFFLPTRGENYGHVIAEALGAGTPVLLSDATPWRGLEAAGVGWDLPLEDPSAFAKAVEAAAAQTADAQAAQREQVFRFAKRRQDESADVEANRQLFRHALATGL